MLRCKASELLRNEAYLAVRRSDDPPSLKLRRDKRMRITPQKDSMGVSRHLLAKKQLNLVIGLIPANPVPKGGDGSFAEMAATPHPPRPKGRRGFKNPG
jgi:hypothetical protein